MKIGKKLRSIWHNIYYTMTFRKGREFAMRCKDVVHQIDLRNENQPGLQKFRINLHLSLCQACKNYSDASLAIRQAVRNAVKLQEQPERLEKLNNNLLKKYSEK